MRVFIRDFAGRTAVINAGGTGMGRELARQLVAKGDNVAIYDVSTPAMEASRLCEVERLPQGLRTTTRLADVSGEAQLIRFRDEVTEQHETAKVDLLFERSRPTQSNAGHFLKSECCLNGMAGPACAEV